jgi:N-acetylglucosamine kinase-like BadF-type ATPase
VILQHGTGFTAAYRSAYGNEQTFDHLDAGRFFDLRASALALAARMIDGRTAISPLKAAILAALGEPAEKDYAEIVFLRKITPAQAADLLPVVFRVAEAGDAATLALVERAIADYVCTALAMIRKIGHGEPDVVFGGGRLLPAPDWFWRRLEDGVRTGFPGARVKRPELSPAIGAAVMAAHADGCPPARFFPARPA